MHITVFHTGKQPTLPTTPPALLPILPHSRSQKYEERLLIIKLSLNQPGQQQINSFPETASNFISCQFWNIVHSQSNPPAEFQTEIRKQS